MIDVIIPNEVYLEYQEELRAVFVVVEGTVRGRGTVTSVVAGRVRRLR